MNFCENNPDTCQNGAKCISLIKEDGSYKCLCREGTKGRNCEISEHSTSTKPTTTDNTESSEETQSSSTKKPEGNKDEEHENETQK